MKQKRISSMIVAFALACTLIFNSVPGEVMAASNPQLNKKNVTMAVGTKYTLRVKNLPKKAKVTWTSSNKKRATVSKKGVVTAKKAGTVTIRSAIKQSGKKTKRLTCKIKINKKMNMGKTLVIYFSVPEIESGNSKVDAMAGASIVASGSKRLGNIQYVASVIQKNMGADTFRIQPEKAYPIKHSTLVGQAEKEQEQDARPAIKNKLKNLGQYDTVFIGYPIWWSDMPQIMYTFFDTYDFGGKTIIPFTVHGGSGLSGTVSRIQKLEPDAVVYKKALSIDRDNVGKSESKITSWLSGLKGN